MLYVLRRTQGKKTFLPILVTKLSVRASFYSFFTTVNSD